MKISLTLGALTLLLVACSSTPFEKEIDDAFAKVSAEVRAPGQRLPWAVGQWARFRLTQRSEETLLGLFSGESRSVWELAITRQEGDAFWVECRRAEPDEELRAAVLVRNVRPDRLRDMVPLKVKVLRDDGEVEEVEGDREKLEAASPFVSQLKVLAALADLRGGTGRVREVTVPAGTFREAYAVPLSLPFRTGRRTGHLWFTDSVPIVHGARFLSRQVSWIWLESTDLAELVDFGEHGAKSFIFTDASLDTGAGQKGSSPTSSGQLNSGQTGSIQASPIRTGPDGPQG
jgi:hypothetical protein